METPKFNLVVLSQVSVLLLTAAIDDRVRRRLTTCAPSSEGLGVSTKDPKLSWTILALRMHNRRTEPNYDELKGVARHSLLPATESSPTLHISSVTPAVVVPLESR
uniref:Putative secreted protein n=1 Tax=Ixodes ricinus TaxID=34613 RepID=A0A6B0UBF3_IXORI